MLHLMFTLPFLLMAAAAVSMAVAAWVYMCICVVKWMVRLIFGNSRCSRAHYRNGPYSFPVQAELQRVQQAQHHAPPTTPVSVCSTRRRRSGSKALVMTVVAACLVTIGYRNLVHHLDATSRPHPAVKREPRERAQRQLKQRVQHVKDQALALLARDGFISVGVSNGGGNSTTEWDWWTNGVGENVEEATRDALEKAHGEVLEFLRSHSPTVVWPLTVGYVDKYLIKENQPDKDVMMGDNLGSAKQRRLHVQITPADYRNILEHDHRYRMESRMFWLGRMLAGLLAVLGTLAVYFRLDEASKGYYTGLLRAGAMAAVVAAAGTLWYFA